MESCLQELPIILKTTKHYSPTPSQTITDQLRFVVAKFKEDLDTREACITIHDPIADDFNAMNTDPITNYTSVLRTKDTPCTRSIHFMVVGGKMNCYVDMRSNDVWWGFSAVNVFNFTLMQEYVANIVGVPIGKYYHKVDNIHVYDNFLEKLVQIANKYPEDSFPSGSRYEYKTTFNSLQAFDKLVNKPLDENIFDLTNAILSKDRQKIFSIYHDLMILNEEPIKLIVSIANQMRLHYQVKLLDRKGYTDQEIGKILGGLTKYYGKNH